MRVGCWPRPVGSGFDPEPHSEAVSRSALCESFDRGLYAGILQRLRCFAVGLAGRRRFRSAAARCRLARSSDYDDVGAAVLPGAEVARDVLAASKRGWPLLFGLPLGLALIAGVIQCLLEGANQKAWHDVTGNTFLASLITLVAAIAVMIIVQVVRAPLVRARRAIVDHRVVVRKLREENDELRAKLGDDDSLMADLKELATEIDAFWTEYDELRKRQKIPSPEAGQTIGDYERTWSDRFAVRAFWMCDRLHRRGWITTERWDSLRDPTRSY
jgi:hypothetical protein